METPGIDSHLYSYFMTEVTLQSSGERVVISINDAQINWILPWNKNIYPDPYLKS